MPSGSEWIIVLVVVLVIFGGSQIPKLARNLGKAQKEFKDGLSEGEREARADELAKRAESPGHGTTTTAAETVVDPHDRPTAP